MVFIAVLLSLERAANRKTRSTCGTGFLQSQNDPVPVCSSTRTGSVKYDSAVPPCLLCFPAQSLSRRANTPLSCNGDFRPKLLRLAAHLPGPRRPTNLCPALARFHCPGSLQMRCAGSLPPHRFDCIIHFIRVKSRGKCKIFFFLSEEVVLLFVTPFLCGACARRSMPCTPATPRFRQ